MNWNESKNFMPDGQFDHYGEERKEWQALQSFYRFKSLLLPDFAKRNARNLGDIEAKLIKQYEEGGDAK